jgi:predicted RNase H-like HicB family nuclease
MRFLDIPWSSLASTRLRESCILIFGHGSLFGRQLAEIGMLRITGYIEKDPETGLYVAVVPGIPGAHTQAETLDELHANLREVVELCLEEMDEEARKQIPQFVGIQQLEVAD